MKRMIPGRRRETTDSLRVLLLVAAALVLGAGCGSKERGAGRAGSAAGGGVGGMVGDDEGSASAVRVAAPAAPVLAEKSPDRTAGELIDHKLSEESFIESDANRDPFRSFLIPLTKKSEYTSASQVESVLDQYQLDELKLIAIISGSGVSAGSPMAMIIDPTGIGYIIRRGNYVGKGETVRRVSSGEEVQIFWKVARIREDAVVFEREDPFSSTEATVTKILALAPNA